MHTYKTEFLKNYDEQDSKLMSECLESIEFYDSAEQMLRMNKRMVSRFSLQRAVACALIVLTVLLASTGIAQACGLRVWSALVHWDSEYLHIAYAAAATGDAYENPPMDNYPTHTPADSIALDNSPGDFQYNEYATLGELYKGIGANLDIPEAIYNYSVTSIVAVRADKFTDVIVNFSLNDKYIVFEYYICNDDVVDEYNATDIFYHDATNAKTEIINDTECTFIENTDYLVAMFNTESFIQFVRTNAEVTMLHDVLQLIIKAD